MFASWILPLVRAVARVCQKAGARAARNIRLADMNIDAPVSDDNDRRIEGVASGLSLWQALAGGACHHRQPRSSVRGVQVRCRRCASYIALDRPWIVSSVWVRGAAAPKQMIPRVGYAEGKTSRLHRFARRRGATSSSGAPAQDYASLCKSFGSTCDFPV